MKIIVMIHHDRHTEDVLKVFPFSEENVQKVKELMQNRWSQDKGSWGYFGDLPSENGEQFGWSESYYSSYSVVEVQNA